MGFGQSTPTDDELKKINELLVKIKRLQPLQTLPTEERRIIEQSGIPVPKFYNLAFTGPQHAGKSAFINTICRILNEDKEQMIHYVRTAPLTSNHCTMFLEAIYIENYNFRLIDCKGLGAVNPLVEIEFFEICVERGVEPGCMLTAKAAQDHINPDFKFHATVVVVSPEHLDQETILTNLRKLSDKMKIGNGRPILVITRKDQMNEKKIKENKAKLIDHTDSELIYCVKNYICPIEEERALFIPPRSSDTELNVLDMLKTFFREADRNLLHWARKELAKKRQGQKQIGHE